MCRCISCMKKRHNLILFVITYQSYNLETVRVQRIHIQNMVRITYLSHPDMPSKRLGILNLRQPLVKSCIDKNIDNFSRTYHTMMVVDREDL